MKLKTSKRKLRIKVEMLDIPEKVLLLKELDYLDFLRDIDRKEYYIAYAIINNYTLIKHGEDIIWKVLYRQVNLLK